MPHFLFLNSLIAGKRTRESRQVACQMDEIKTQSDSRKGILVTARKDVTSGKPPVSAMKSAFIKETTGCNR